MKPVEPFLESIEAEAAQSGAYGDSLFARLAASAVLCAAVATIVWYVVDAVIAL
jgi:hypothetical protein